MTKTVDTNMPSSTSLQLNGVSHNHSHLISKHLKSAKRFDCAVAFAKWSGFRLIREILIERLEAGMEARFFIGLDFYQSEPKVLDALLKLKGQYNVSVFVSRTADYSTFHLKAYRFRYDDAVALVIGSANLTKGGLCDNHEVSVVQLFKIEHDFLSYLDDLVDEEEVEELTKTKLTSYRKRYEAYRVLRTIAETHIDLTLNQQEPGIEALREKLRMMRQGGSNSNFAIEVQTRTKSRQAARKILLRIERGAALSRAAFLSFYDSLAGKYWHSGGLQRSKTKIAKTPSAFQRVVRATAQQHAGKIADVFQSLQKLTDRMTGMGPNILTEILQTYDNTRYAVMNQNSVAGMRTAGYFEFPERPSKQNVDGQLYETFCARARFVQQQLGLADLSELDAVFNYAYWS